MTASSFKVGDRVKDKRDGAHGVLREMRRHTNGSPKWLVQWDAERISTWTWEVDLRLVAAATEVAR